MHRIVSVLLYTSIWYELGNIIDSTNTEENTKACAVFYLIHSLLSLTPYNRAQTSP